MNDPRFSFLDTLTDGNANSISTRASTTRIRIAISSAAAHTFAGQVLVYQLATLAARFFDNVEVVGDEVAHTDARMTLVSGAFLPGLRAILPTLRPMPPFSETAQTVTVVVGDDSLKGDLYLGATAWSALFSKTQAQPITDAAVSLGALAAGTLGAAEIFKFVFSVSIKGAYSADGYTLSLLDYRATGGTEPPLPERIDLTATLFGCGSIGCGLVLGLILTPQIHGEIVAVDNGKFDTKNPYKYTLLNWTDAEQGMQKAPWVEQQIACYAGSRLRCQPFIGTANTYVASLPPDYRISLAASAVDTAEARMEIQDTLPRYIVNAGIAGTLTEVSVHGFGNGPCLACLAMQTEMESWKAEDIGRRVGLSGARVYQLIRQNEGLSLEDVQAIRDANVASPPVLATLDTFIGQPLLSLWQKVAYSQAPVQTAGEPPVLVTTAFVSAFAGILLLAELIKMSVPSLYPYIVNNSYRQEIMGVPAENVFKHSRDITGGCLCHSSFRQAIYREKYAAGQNTGFV